MQGRLHPFPQSAVLAARAPRDRLAAVLRSAGPFQFASSSLKCLPCSLGDDRLQLRACKVCKLAERLHLRGSVLATEPRLSNQLAANFPAGPAASFELIAAYWECHSLSDTAQLLFAGPAADVSI